MPGASLVRRFVREWVVYGRLNGVARPLYDLLIRQELAVLRVVDALFPGPQLPDLEALDQVTALIKTFERPQAVKRLVASIRRFYPALKVVVVDDSQEPISLPGVELVTLPFRSGVSAGRREGLRAVQTEYVLVLDDDFVFYRRTSLGQAVAYMKAQPEVDIMGGKVVNLPFFTAVDYRNSPLYPTEARPTLPPGSQVGRLPVYHKVANFFLGRTERVRQVNWDPAIRKLEHSDFFTRAVGVLTTVYNEEMRCLHARTPFNTGYMKQRYDHVDDHILLWDRYYRPKETKEK
jgi:glycosyltransferase involved in cell wall biosynthesis